MCIPNIGRPGDSDALTFYMFRDGADVIHSISPYYDVELDLSVPSFLKLNEIAEVKCTVTAIDNDVPEVRIRLMPNDRYYIIQRDLSWEGDLTANVPIQVTAQIKPIRVGYFPIPVRVENYRSLSNRYIEIAGPKDPEVRVTVHEAKKSP